MGQTFAERLMAFSYRPGQPRDKYGRWVSGGGGTLSEKDNLRRGVKALRSVIRNKKDMRKAMFRKEVGQIDFLWGTPGNKSAGFKGGWGISHALAKHGVRDVMKIPFALAMGKVMKHPSGRADKKLVVYKNFELSLFRENKRRSWVMTGFTNSNK